MIGSLLKTFRRKPNISITQPPGPVVKSHIPGPQSLALLNDYQGLSTSFRDVRFFIDYNRSIGNYIFDADQNFLLDTHPHDLPIGYNNPHFNSYMKGSTVQYNIAHRSACIVQPPQSWVNRMKHTLVPLAPEGLSEVFSACGCSNGAVENALKAALLHKFKQEYGENPSQEILKSALMGQPPGATEYSILSFEGSLHGKFLGCASVSTKYNMKGFPVYKWPVAPFPKVGDSSAAEKQALVEAEKIIKEQKGKLAGAILEPVQIESGIQYASIQYYQGIEKLCKQNGITFIINQANIGLATTGKMYSHQLYDLSPDILVVGGNPQFGFYFAKPEYRPFQTNILSNTWCGQPLRVIALQGILKVIQQENLIDQAQKVGSYLVENLKNISSKGKFSNVRGVGLNVAFDFANKEEAWKYCKAMLNLGVNTVVKENSIIVRPALVFQKKHADIFLSKTEESLQFKLVRIFQ